MLKASLGISSILDVSTLKMPSSDVSLPKEMAFPIKCFKAFNFDRTIIGIMKN
jgi:hypothetical protein